MKKSTRLRTLLSALFLAFSHSVTADTISIGWGALATSSVTTCADVLCTSTTTISEEMGGNMNADVSTNIIDAGIPAGWESSAHAMLSDAANSYTPSLGVRAAVENGTDLVLSTASGIQSYTNLGGDRTLTIDLLLTTQEVSGIASILGNVAIYRTDALEFVDGDINNVALDPAIDTIGESVLSDSLGNASISFNIAPNESFLILASLSALAISSGTADASNTLTMVLLENGNTLDLTDFAVASRSVGAVPLPAGVWLFLSGIGLVIGLTRRRNIPAS